MNGLRDFFQSDQYKKNIYPEIKRFVAVVVFTMVYGIGLVWFLEQAPMPLYTGGVPGVAQLVRDFMLYHMNISLGANDGLFLGIFIIVGNIPIVILGWFGVSKRFTIYSLVSILLQATILGFIPPINLGLTEPSHMLVCALLGGALIGIGTGGALKYGASTGGLDIVAQYFALKKGKTVGILSMFMNVAIAIVGGLVVNGFTNSEGITYIGGLIASYTIIRIVISSVMTDKVHTAYQYLSVQIVTAQPVVIIDEILTKLHRGVTIQTVHGAFSKDEKSLVLCVLATYELPSLQEIIKEVDEKAFVIVQPVKTILGNFTRRTIA